MPHPLNFHSEADFQHNLAWQIHLANPHAQVRLETRSARNIRLDLLVMSAGQRTAIELKYLVRSFRGDIGGEHYDLSHQAAQDFGEFTMETYMHGDLEADREIAHALASVIAGLPKGIDADDSMRAVSALPNPLPLNTKQAQPTMTPGLFPW